MKQVVKKLCDDIEQLNDSKVEKYLTNLLKHYELMRANGKTDILQAFKNAVIAPNRKERLLNSRHTQMIKKIAQRQKKHSKTYRILMRYKFEIIELYLAGYGVRKIAKEDANTVLPDTASPPATPIILDSATPISKNLSGNLLANISVLVDFDRSASNTTTFLSCSPISISVLP